MSIHQFNPGARSLINNLAFMGALVFIAALAINTRAFRDPKDAVGPSTSVTTTAEPSSSASTPQRERRQAPVQVVRFTLYDVGIIPERAYARPGLVTIALEDLSGGTTGLVIERNEEGQARARTGDVRRKEKKRHGQEELRLEAGRYQLYMADRPDNRAELIVEP